MKLDTTRLFGPEPLAGRPPSQVKFSPDGKRLGFLRPAQRDRERLELWLHEVGGATRLVPTALRDVEVARLSAVERAERERRRQFATGVTSWSWHPASDAVLVAHAGATYLHRFADSSTRRVSPEGSSAAKLSPDGKQVAYVRGGDLFVANVDGDEERRLTSDGSDTVTNGLPEFVAQEEMHRFEGYWWSPDSRTIAFTRVDDAQVPVSHRHEIGAEGIAVVPQRYPFAGAENAQVRLAVCDVAASIRGAGAHPTVQPAPRGNVPVLQWLDWAMQEDDYLARVQFGADGALWVQAQSRNQRRLSIRRRTDGDWQEVAEVRSETWIDLDDNLHCLPDGRALHTAEADGRVTLHVDGTPLPIDLKRTNNIVGARDELAWVTGWRQDPTEQHLYRVHLGNGEAEPITRGGAWHDATLHEPTGLAAITRATLDAPASLELVELRDAGGTRSRTVAPTNDEPPAPALLLPHHSRAQLGRITGADGEPLHYRVTPPAPFDPNTRYPVVVHVYGGPGVQRVRREMPPLMLQLFAQAGFGVFELDNRGSTNRSAAFEKPIHGQLGAVEVADQLRGLEYLHSLPWVHAERIAVFGHSYGGYMALMCLATEPDAFAAGVAVAPVTDWRLYDTHYTERYLGKPQENEAGYDASSPLPKVANIRSPLLLMHGMADDNVLFTHSTRLMKALQDANVPFDLMTYPGAKHSMQERAVATHRFETILRFLERELAVERSS
ncbi:MAG: alpha/beta fold hydrolase [Gammaproteobacteria bacterium]|nr:alpha/beta fold hydrolase [Gammaproteobacteria bacterium]